MSGIASPCIRLCRIDAGSGLCAGCLRSLAEIAGWSGFSARERAAIMAELPKRRGVIGEPQRAEERPSRADGRELI